MIGGVGFHALTLSSRIGDLAQPLPDQVELFGEFLDAMPDGILVVDGAGRIVGANRQMEELSGYGKEDLVGQPVEAVIPARYHHAHRRHRDQYFASTPRRRAMGAGLDIHFLRQDGTEFPADISLSPIDTPEGTWVVAAVRDTSDRLLAERALQQEQERFRLVVEGVSDYAIYMVDTQGRIATWSQAAEAITGYSAGEIIGRDRAVLYPPEDVAAGKPQADLDRAAAVGRFEEETWRRRKDGRRFWASIALTPLRDEAGGLRGFANISRDVTAQRRELERIEGLLAMSQGILAGRDVDELLEQLAQRARDLVGAAIATVSVPTGRGDFLIQIARGEQAEPLKGLRVPANRSIAARVLSARSPLIVRDVAQEQAGPEPPDWAFKIGPAMYLPLFAAEHDFGTLVLFNPRGGQEFTTEDLESVEVFATQAVVGLEYARVRGELQRLALVEDRERIGRELHDGAVQALFAVGMSLQAAEMLTQDVDLQRRLEEAVKQLDQVIRDLRNYIFGLRPGILADRQLEQALRGLAADFESQSGVTTVVDVDARLASELTELASDLVQIATEALSNVGRHAKAMTCRLSLRREGDSALLEVEDDGQGFDAGQLDGLGQGLRNYGERASSIGAELAVVSDPGQGTTVRLRLPGRA